MKRFSLALILVCICTFTLSACKESEQVDYGNEYVYEQDAQNFSVAKGATFTENGFYVINSDTSNIDFVDKVTGTTVPLCGKPDCKHKDELCNANFIHPLCIQYYDNYLYIVADGSKEETVYLHKMSLDGSERIELRTLFKYEEGDNASCSMDFSIHRGYGYMVTNWIENDRHNEREQVLYRIFLNGDKKEELYKISGYSPMIYIEYIEGNNIYLRTEKYDNKESIISDKHFLQFDIVKNVTTEVDIPQDHYLVAVRDAKIYTLTYDDTSSALYCIDGKNQKNIYECKYDEAILYKDNKFVYFDNEFYLSKNDMPYAERKITAIDYDGNIVFEIDNLEYGELKWSDSEQLLIRDVQNEECRYSLFDLSTQEEIPLKGYTLND